MVMCMAAVGAGNLNGLRFQPACGGKSLAGLQFGPADPATQDVEERCAVESSGNFSIGDLAVGHCCTSDKRHRSPDRKCNGLMTQIRIFGNKHDGSGALGDQDIEALRKMGR